MLDRLNHIVVVMMENRSFDHMLGYLRPAGFDVDGFDGTQSETHKGEVHEPKLLEKARFWPDPRHDWDSIAGQMTAGFVQQYDKQPFTANPGKVMGYYDQSTVPAYDFFARNYAVCDRWFASLPGPTIPNRLYGFAGTSEGERGMNFAPTHKKETVFRVLQRLAPPETTWRYYHHDLPTLLLYEDHAKNRAGIRHFRHFASDLSGTGASPRLASVRHPSHDQAHRLGEQCGGGSAERVR